MYQIKKHIKFMCFWSLLVHNSWCFSDENHGENRFDMTATIHADRKMVGIFSDTFMKEGGIFCLFLQKNTTRLWGNIWHSFIFINLKAWIIYILPQLVLNFKSFFIIFIPAKYCFFLQRIFGNLLVNRIILLIVYRIILLKNKVDRSSVFR